MADWSGKTRGGTFGYLFFIALIKKCGITAAYVFLAFIVPYFVIFAPKATQNIRYYARKILHLGKISSLRLLIVNYYRLGQILIDKVAIGNGMKEKYKFSFEQYDEFLDVLNSDKEVVIIGAHVGNWEIGTPFFDEYGKKINIVLYDAEYQKIKQLLEKNSANSDFKVIPINHDSLAHVFQIKEALEKKEYVCFQGDRFVNQERLLETTFMGKKASFPMGPFLIASKLNANVVFYFAMRESHRTYKFHFTLASPITKQNGVRKEQNLLEQYVKALEQVLRQYPEQWFNYYSFWEDKTEKLC